MEDLEKLRDKIDSIDEKIVMLFEERMNTVLKVAEYKKQNNIPILNQNREKQVIEKNKKYLKCVEFEDYLKEFLKNLMDISKKIQQNNIFE